jgi:hemerythrin-like domain-containing protein
MLLATYALLTLRIEQKRERASIQELQDCLARPAHCDDFDGAELATRSEQLIEFAESRHQRRLENGLFPALRAASVDAGESLRKLEHLGRVGLEILPRIRSVLRPGARLGKQQIARVCILVQAYCQNLLERLACEEEDLLPLAERLLPSEIWFKVGTEFLMQDAQRA